MNIVALMLAATLTASPAQVEEVQVREVEQPYSVEEIDLMARIVANESLNQGYLGQCYVADVILNRVESDKFPNTVYEVVSQKGQFSTFHTRYKFEPTEETYQAIQDEIAERKQTDILFFRTKKYHSGTTPVLQYEDHYFSK